MSISLLTSVSALPQGFYLCDCAVSGGTLEAFLKKAMHETQGRLCVRLQPVHMDFPLPCPSGTGVPLSAGGAQQLCQSRRKIFSKALCTEYVSFFQKNQLHLVLSDTRETLRQKLRLCEAVGVPYGLIQDEGLFQFLSCE